MINFKMLLSKLKKLNKMKMNSNLTRGLVNSGCYHNINPKLYFSMDVFGAQSFVCSPRIKV